MAYQYRARYIMAAMCVAYSVWRYSAAYQRKKSINIWRQSAIGISVWQSMAAWQKAKHIKKKNSEIAIKQRWRTRTVGGRKPYARTPNVAVII